MGNENEINLTYETLFDILRNEKNRSVLQDIPKNFLKDVVNYLKQKKESLIPSKTEDLFLSIEKERGVREINNIKRIIKEILERRLKKITELALLNLKTSAETKETENMLEEEKIIYEKLKDAFIKYKRSVIDKVLNLEEPSINFNEEKKEEKKEYVLVRFLHPVPKFIGDDLKVYGPFKEEEIAKLPRKVVEILVKKRRAEIINEE